MSTPEQEQIKKYLNMMRLRNALASNGMLREPFKPVAHLVSKEESILYEKPINTSDS